MEVYQQVRAFDKGSMRILMLSKALVVGTYQRKLEEMASLPGVELTAVVPSSWRDPSGELRLERAHVRGYQMRVEPIRLNGNFHLHYYPTLPRLMREIRPQIVHIDEEPYNLATWHALYFAKRIGAKTLFFSWQNIARNYPFPFSAGESWTLRNVDYAIMGTESAAEIWREKGYRGRLRIIPQFGVDPAIFKPSEERREIPVIGYAGRLEKEKGIDLLLEALSRIKSVWKLIIIGQGAERESLEQQVHSLNLTDRVEFRGYMSSTQMPEYYPQFDILALPSRTMPNWKEQFGRVIIEAMACGVPVLGSDSAAIPGVVGEGGLIFPEGNIGALSEGLEKLLSNPALRAELGCKGRQHVLENYTHAQVAAQSVEVYREMLQVNT